MSRIEINVSSAALKRLDDLAAGRGTSRQVAAQDALRAGLSALPVSSTKSEEPRPSRASKPVIAPVEGEEKE